MTSFGRVRRIRAVGGEPVGKLIVMVMMCGMIWVGMEIHTKGANNAFGGAFSFLTVGDDMPEKASEYVSTPRRVGNVVDERIQEGAARYDKMLDE
jgi:hypothetical protein